MTGAILPRGLWWGSYILQGIVAVMFGLGAVMNIIGQEDTVANSVSMGYPEASLLPLGVVLLTAVILYIIPKTSIVGAGLLTAWLGGAVATHIIHGDSISETLFPVVFGILVWLALWMRDLDLRTVFPWHD